MKNSTPSAVIDLLKKDPDQSEAATKEKTATTTTLYYASIRCVTGAAPTKSAPLSTYVVPNDGLKAKIEPDQILKDMILRRMVYRETPVVVLEQKEPPVEIDQRQADQQQIKLHQEPKMDKMKEPQIAITLRI